MRATTLDSNAKTAETSATPNSRPSAKAIASPNVPPTAT